MKEFSHLIKKIFYSKFFCSLAESADFKICELTTDIAAF